MIFFLVVTFLGHPVSQKKSLTDQYFFQFSLRQSWVKRSYVISLEKFNITWVWLWFRANTYVGNYFLRQSIHIITIIINIPTDIVIIIESLIYYHQSNIFKYYLINWNILIYDSSKVPQCLFMVLFCLKCKSWSDENLGWSYQRS